LTWPDNRDVVGTLFEGSEGNWAGFPNYDDCVSFYKRTQALDVAERDLAGMFVPTCGNDPIAGWLSAWETACANWSEQGLSLEELSGERDLFLLRFEPVLGDRLAERRIRLRSVLDTLETRKVGPDFRKAWRVLWACKRMVAVSFPSPRSREGVRPDDLKELATAVKHVKEWLPRLRDAYERAFWLSHVGDAPVATHLLHKPSRDNEPLGFENLRAMEETLRVIREDPLLRWTPPVAKSGPRFWASARRVSLWKPHLGRLLVEARVPRALHAELLIAVGLLSLSYVVRVLI
jgi:hypothetical protein